MMKKVTALPKNNHLKRTKIYDIVYSFWMIVALASFRFSRQRGKTMAENKKCNDSKPHPMHPWTERKRGRPDKSFNCPGVPGTIKR